MVGDIYLVFLGIAMGVAYLPLHWLFPYFFGQVPHPLGRRQVFRSVGTILLAALVLFALSTIMPDQDLGNRFLHTFGGGFLAFGVCFFAARDSRVHIGTFQFFFFSVLLVLALGIANELVEFVLQLYTGFPFAPSILDTWLDLTSNLVGVLLASMYFVPRYKKVGLRQ